MDIVARVRKAAPALALIVGVVLATPPLAAHAAQPGASRQREIQAEIERLRAELDEVAADEADVLADLHVTQRLRAEEQAKLAAVQAEYDAAAAALAAAQAEVDAASAAERAARDRAERVRAKLDDARQTLKDQAISAFIAFGSGAERLDLVLRAGNIRELRHARAFVDSVAEQQSEVVGRFADLEDDFAELEAEAAAARAAAAARRNDVQARTAEVEAARGRQAAATAALAAEAAHEESLLESLRGRRNDYEQRIREQQRESDAIAELLRRRSATGGPAFVSGRGTLSPPLGDPIVTSSYGYRVHPIFGDRRLHTGLDFRAPTGVPILAAGPGEVVFAGWRGGYGNCTIVDHGGGVATLYAHQSAMTVAVGDQVVRGQVIGSAGSTGYATGPHLHFEVRRDGAPVDPMAFL